LGETSSDDNLVNETTIQPITPKLELDLSRDENSNSVNEKILENSLVEEECVKPDIETKKMPIDEKSFDSKNLNQKSIHSDNSVDGKLNDKNHSINRKNPELDNSRIIHENNNVVEAQVDKSQLIQEWPLDMEDDPLNK
jgi:hypothetical protein